MNSQELTDTQNAVIAVLNESGLTVQSKIARRMWKMGKRYRLPYAILPKLEAMVNKANQEAKP